MRFPIAALVLAAGCGASDPPELLSVEPTTISIGQTFTITGERLCQSSMVNADGTCPGGVPGTVEIDIDYKAVAPVTTWTDTMITATLPDNSPHGQTTVFIYSKNNASNALYITVP